MAVSASKMKEGHVMVVLTGKIKEGTEIAVFKGQ